MFLLHPSYFPLDMNSFQSPGVWLVVCTKSVGYLWFGTRVGPFRVISFGADTMKPADKKNYQNSFLVHFFSSSSYSENNRTTSDVHDIFFIECSMTRGFFCILMTNSGGTQNGRFFLTNIAAQVANKRDNCNNNSYYL